MGLKSIELVYKLSSPVIISQKASVTNYIFSLNYLPGTSIYGAIMSKFITQIPNIMEIYLDGYLRYNHEFGHENNPQKNNNKNNNNNQPNSSLYNHIFNEYKKYLEDSGQFIVSDFLPIDLENFFQEDLDNLSVLNVPISTPPLKSIVKCRIDQKHIFDSTLFEIKKWYYNLQK
ncbi:MAG: hypothetical protein ACTSWL_07505, partial [Promethearchaeota archaeon]